MIDVVGLGPGDLDRVPPAILDLLADPDRTVVVRTIEHPAASRLSANRDVVGCDDLYERAKEFADVYDGIARRVLEAAARGSVVYAVPGSPFVGELAVGLIRSAAERAQIDVVVHPAESFVDAVLAVEGIDPLGIGLRILNAHDLGDPLVFDVPTIVGQVDRPEILADLMALLDRILPEETEVTLHRDLGSRDQQVVRARPLDHEPAMAGVRTSVYVPAASSGLLGAVHVMQALRDNCPWDRKQTHHSLVRYLIEESHELADAIAALPAEGAEPDWGAYADVEEELGDVFLQVLFHAVIASQAGAFDITDVAEQLRVKLTRRHPHVFGDVEADDAETVKRNWDQIKAEEKGGVDAPRSAVDGIPPGLPGLERAAELQRKAAKVGFDWEAVEPVVDKIQEEIGEVRAVLDDHPAAAHEVGDLLFAVVNLARHLDIVPEVAIRAANHRFESRFRAMEAMGSLEGLTLDELDARWEAAKRSE